MANPTGQNLDYQDAVDSNGQAYVTINGSDFNLTGDNYQQLASQEYQSLLSNGVTDNGNLLQSISDHYGALASASDAGSPAVYNLAGPPVANSGSGYTPPLPSSGDATSYGILDGLFDYFNGTTPTGVDSSGNVVEASTPNPSPITDGLTAVASSLDVTLKTVQIGAIVLVVFLAYKISKS